MKAYIDCYPCFLRQSIAAARHAKCPEPQLHGVVQSVLDVLRQLQPDANPAEIACLVHRIVREKLNNEDPYENEKKKSTQMALSLYPRLKERLVPDNNIENFLRMSIAGNIIDLGVSDQYDDLWSTVERVLVQPFAIDDSKALVEKLDTVDRLLFLADNAGETVFDRILIESLPHSVVYAVKENPVLNDATRKDALAAGLDQCTEIVSNGSDAPGTVLPLCSDEFVALFESYELIIAKGQANYESLSMAGEKVFCLLQVKCPVIGADIGAPVGGIVIRQSRQEIAP